MEKKTIYVAGPMRGIPYFNFPAFDKAQDLLESDGWEVFNPANLDRQDGFDPLRLPSDYDWNGVEGFDLAKCVKRDLEALQESDAIYLLPGWEASVGARSEFSVAKWLGKAILYAEGAGAHPQEPWIPSTTETESADADTGARKGVKLARFDLMPVHALWELAEHFGRGAEKYAIRNWEKGYDWSKNYAAAIRHLMQFWAGEDFDKELGSKHVIAAAWHCIVLATFMETHPEKDDRAPIMKEKGRIEQ